MRISFLLRSTLLFTFGLVLSMIVPATVDAAVRNPGSPKPSATPTYTGYKGVKIGMTTDEARKLLGNPKEKSEGQDYYLYSDNEAAQIVYDSTHKVTAISVTYMGKRSSIPTPQDIFGEDAEVKPDGSIAKMVRYPKEGFWVSYNRTAGDDPVVIVTAQKLTGGSE
jgi:hypothetical protein